MPEDRTGPRGGKTTITDKGMVRKTIWFNADEVEALRLQAFKERRPESEIVREAIRRYLSIPD